METVSLCLICQDEEKRVSSCLAKLINHVDEICIVDGGSKDKTVDIIQALDIDIMAGDYKGSIKFKQIPFPHNFAMQKNEALALATKDWILWIDCDEYYEEEFVKNIGRIQEQANLNGYDALQFPRKTSIDGYLHNIFDFDYQIRFWKRSSGIKFVGRLHESPVGMKKLGTLNFWIMHDKTAREQHRDDATYWNMGQNPPPGWEKVNDEWTNKETGEVIKL